MGTTPTPHEADGFVVDRPRQPRGAQATRCPSTDVVGRGRGREVGDVAQHGGSLRAKSDRRLGERR